MILFPHLNRFEEIQRHCQSGKRLVCLENKQKKKCARSEGTSRKETHEDSGKMDYQSIKKLSYNESTVLA